MPITSTKTIKSEKKSKKLLNDDISLRTQSRFVDDVIRISSSKKFLTSVGLSKISDFTGQVRTPSVLRIGEVKNRKTYDITITIDDSTILQQKNNRISIIGGKKSRYETKNFIDSGRQGINVLSDNQRVLSFKPRISANGRLSEDEDLFFVQDYENCNLGQSYFVNTYDNNQNKIKSFLDIPGRFNPVDYIEKRSSDSDYFFSYPVINNVVSDLPHYADPSHLKNDGAIDVFNSKTSVINTYTSDIQIRGIKGSLSGGGVLILGDRSEKGSVEIVDLVENNEEKSSQIDFFEDAVDILIGGDFPKRSNFDSGGKFYSHGIGSDSKYLKSPFVDIVLSVKSNEYSLLTDSQKNSLLNSSDRSRSKVGYNFKSMNCGLIFGESNVLGTDSISFGGLKK